MPILHASLTFLFAHAVIAAQGSHSRQARLSTWMKWRERTHSQFHPALNKECLATFIRVAFCFWLSVLSQIGAIGSNNGVPNQQTVCCGTGSGLRNCTFFLRCCSIWLRFRVIFNCSGLAILLEYGHMPMLQYAIPVLNSWWPQQNAKFWLAFVIVRLSMALLYNFNHAIVMCFTIRQRSQKKP